MILPKHNPPEEAGMKVSFKKPNVEDPFQTYEMVDFLIETKKHRYQKYLAAKSLAFSVGLFLSCFLVVLLFEWKTYEKTDALDVASSSELFDEILDIPVTEQPPPPPQKKLQQPNIIEAEVEEIIEEIEIDFDVDITSETVVETVDTEGFEDLMTDEKADEIFDIVEFQPTPIGGMQGFMTFVAENIKYPNSALRAKVQGKVFVQFVVNTDGSLVDFKVIKGIGSGCDEEALRVLKQAPKWEPGKQRGKAVRVRMLVPVFFKLKER